MENQTNFLYMKKDGNKKKFFYIIIFNNNLINNINNIYIKNYSH